MNAGVAAAPASTTFRQPTRRLPGLEAQRLVAALCVLLLHTGAVYGGVAAFGRGYVGVDFFLMLDGFLMARVQEPRLAEAKPWRFLVRRYARLWPLMALGGLIGLPMQYLRSRGIGDFLWVGGLNLALLPAVSRGFVFSLNIPAWTIFAQLVCEDGHVLVLRHMRGRWLWLAIALLAPAVLWIAHGAGGLNVGPTPANLGFGLVRCLFAYMLGMALGRHWRDTQPPPVPPALALIIMPVALVGLWMAGAQRWWIDPLLVVTLCPLMLAGGMRLRRFQPAAALAGRLGFPLFAWQMPIIEGLRYLGATYWIGLAAALAGGGIAMMVETHLARRRAGM